MRIKNLDLQIQNLKAEKMDVCIESFSLGRKGKFFLYATCDMPEDTPLEPDDVFGVDLGVKNIAVDNTGIVFSNEKVPGEGEHKIINFIRKYGSPQESY